MKICVRSFDVGGCIFNDDFKGIYKQENASVLANASLLRRLHKENLKYGANYTLIGSNRQSLYYDLMSANRYSDVAHASCFRHIKQFSDALGAQFDPFLLADVYGNNSSGTAYQKAIQFYTSNANTMPVLSPDRHHPLGHSDYFFDHSKITLILAQLHKTASEHPADDIDFIFYDDQLGKLKALHVFFDKHPQMIPANICFKLVHYFGRETLGRPVAPYLYSQQGIGNIQDFQRLVLNIVKRVVTAVIKSDVWPTIHSYQELKERRFLHLGPQLNVLDYERAFKDLIPPMPFMRPSTRTPSPENTRDWCCGILSCPPGFFNAGKTRHDPVFEKGDNTAVTHRKYKA